MGKSIFIGCALLISLGILKSKGVNRLVWFFTGLLFFQDRIIILESPTVVNFNRLLIYVLFMAELLNPPKLWAELKAFPLIRSLTIVFLGFVSIGIFDDRHDVFLNLYRSIDLFVQTFFVIFLCYVNLKENADWEKLIKFFMISSIILCLYGFFIFVTKLNPVDVFITKTYNSVSFYDQYVDLEERFRINSFVTHPIYYGYLTGALFLLGTYGFVYIRKLKWLCLLAMIFLFLNLLLTNSRTPLFAFVFGLFIFIYFLLKNVSTIRIALIGLCVGVGLYNVPIVQQKVDNVLDIFEPGGGKVTDGSSLKMRNMQLAVSYDEFLKSPIFGNGFYYINETLGYSSDSEKTTSSDNFEGFESIIYELLIEQGLVGIITNIIFFTSVARYFLINKYVNRIFTGLGLGILVMFIIFSVGTGTLSSEIITMALLGIIIKFIELEHARVRLFRKVLNLHEKKYEGNNHFLP